MPLDLKFDPITKDLVSDGKGSYVRTPNADTMLMHQMLCHYGDCWHDENLGSRLHDLKFLQADPAKLGAEEARRALKVLQARGRISDVEAKAEVPKGQPGRVNIVTSARDTSTGGIVAGTTKLGGS